MSNLVISLAMGGGIGALALVAAAYYYGVKSGRAQESDENAANVAGRTQKVTRVLMKEQTAKDVEDSARRGKF